MVRTAKHWCWTLNNPTEEDEQHIQEIANEQTYLVYGREIGESGTRHLQGFVSFPTRRSLSYLKRTISSRVHGEIARGTPRQAAEYCKKDQDFFEVGSLPGGSGTRSDLQELHSRIKSGATRDDIRDEFFGSYLRYTKAIEKFISDQQQDRNWVPEVRVFWGKTGTGKTKSVYEFIERDKIYKHTGDRWFDGYRGQPVVLFDDFTGGVFKLSYLLQLLDRYPMDVPVKGDFVKFIPKHIFITSNINPEDWYPNASEEHKRALFRRITQIKEF